MVKLSDYHLLDTSFRTKFAQVVDEFNQTATAYPRHQTIHGLFREQVLTNPGQIAVEWVDESEQIQQYTYAELDQQSDTIARFLRSRGVQTEDIVAFWIESPQYVIPTVLGILKSGAAYLSLSSTFPFERNRYLIEDTASHIIIFEKKYIKDVQKLQWECASISDFLCLDSADVYAEAEATNELMKKELWDYVGEEAKDDIEGGGWVSSYTGQNLSREVMDEYGDNILKKLQPLLRKTDKVLEIGCSSGISMFRLAPLVAQYYGTDLSDEILKKTEAERQRLGLNNIHLKTLPAHQIDQVGETGFDLIIINSVIQCFNGHNYLRQVLTKALDLLKPEGKIFLGDLMDQDSKDALIASLMAFRKEHLDQGYTTKTDWSNELFISRKYLEDLRHDFPQIVSVEHSEKIAVHWSELSDFLFDTLLTIDKNTTNHPPLLPRHKYQFSQTDLDFWKEGELPAIGGPRNLAYVSYTSGTTGKPKGVLIEHRSVVRLVKNTNYVDIQPSDRLSQLAPLSFDASTFEIWGALLNGATVIPLIREDLLKPEIFEKRMLAQQVSMSFLTTSLFNRLLDECPNAFSLLKVLLIGGEALSPVHINRVREENPLLQVINGYGPTENTTFSACFYINQTYDKAIPIGKPIANTQCYVLKPNLEPVPVGMNGELYVSGDGLARGYLNDPIQTAEKFITHPFLDGEKLYRTGDLAKWLPDGTLRFLGRNDDQVKIRGYRIEITEIESVIQQIAGLKQVLVQVRKYEDDEKFLCAYLVLPPHLKLESIKKELAIQLPSYMLPAYWVVLKEFPLNANGKVDKRLLPDPLVDRAERGKSSLMPRTPLEQTLAQIWQSVLQVPQVTMQDNFFAIGGHSLKATQVVSRVQKKLELDLSIGAVFEYPTLMALSRYLSQQQRVQHNPIRKTPVQEYYELSHAQKRMWILDQFEEERLAYNMPAAFVLEGIDRTLLEKAFLQLVARHESLRTVFVEVNGEPRQKIYPAAQYPFQMGYTDLRAEPQPMETARKMAQQEASMPFDLAKGPLLRTALLEVETGKYVLLFTMHHIISDGWSLGVLMKELMTSPQPSREGGTGSPEEGELDSRPSTGEPNVSSAARVFSPSSGGGWGEALQYRDYAAWQQEQLSGEKGQVHRDYWHAKLGGERLILDLPTDFPRPAIKTTHGAILRHTLHKPLVKTLSELGQKHGASLFFTLLAVTKTLFYRYTRQEDIIVGTPVAGREHPDLEDQIGLYVNTLVLRTQVLPEHSFAQVLENVTATGLDALEHQIYPFDRLVEELNVRPDLSRSPLFNVLVTFQNTGVEKSLDVLPEGVQIEPVDVGGIVTSKFDLTLTFEESSNGVSVEAEYNTDLFAESRINRLLTHLVALAETVAQDPDTKISVVNYLPETEHSQLTGPFSLGVQTNRQQPTLHQWMEEQAILYPDKTAMVYESETYTYAQLHAQANQLAHYLTQTWHLQPNDLVGVSMGRSAQVVTAMLAILKTGAAYVPLDPGYPAHRIAYMVQNSAAKLVICDTEIPEKWTDWTGDTVAFSELLSLTSSYPTHNPAPVSQPSDLAYVLYTSGSTGDPKGVMIAHDAVVNFMQSMQHQPGLSETDVLLAVTPYSFDISILEFFLPLVCGATLVIAAQETVREPALLIEYIQHIQPTVMQATPSLWKSLLESGWQGNRQLTVLCGGEALPASLAQSLLAITGNLWNMYGPTETTIWSVIKHVQSADDSHSIGKPIQQTEVYILDEQQQIVPIGIEGELCIGGSGLAKGYWQKPELTQEKFIPHPFHPNQRLYRTGDVACWLENGEIKFSGRKDTQVKIHGYRIELGEIESHLRRHPDVADVAAHVSEWDGNKELVAYLVVRQPIEASAIRTYLAAYVPAYMVPHHLVYLDQFPRTANGKLDRKRLPVPHRTASTDTYVAPATFTEEKLATIWEQILGIVPIGAMDNFFERGGHSLKATQMVSQIHRELSVKLMLKDIFTTHTLQELALLIDASAQTRYEAIMPVEPQDYYELSHAQKRLWILNQVQENQTAYNMPMVYTYEGTFRQEAFEKTIQTLVVRHESLRTTFVSVNGHPYQQIHAAENWHIPVQYTDVRNTENPKEEAQQLAEIDVRTPFDLEQGPLLRVHVIQVADAQMLLSFHMHHIITDAWSMNILIREALTLYEAYGQQQSITLPALRIQYKDFTAWQTRQSVLNQEEEYWLHKLSGSLEPLRLPYDFQLSETFAFRGNRISYDLNEILTRQLQEVALHNQTSLSNVVFTIFNILLYNITGQQDIMVGIAVANRTHTDLENIIGFFVNSLVIRNTVPEEVEFDQLLRQVSENLVEAFDHQNYPFDLLAQKLRPNLPPEQSLFNVFYGFQAFQTASLPQGKEGGMEAVWGDASVDFQTAKFDLTLFVFQMEDCLRLTLEYNSDRFAARTIEKYLHFFEKITQAILTETENIH